MLTGIKNRRPIKLLYERFKVVVVVVVVYYKALIFMRRSLAHEVLGSMMI